MTAVVRLAAAVATLLIPGPPAPEAPVAQRYSTIGDALAAVIPPGAGTVVLGVGELHQTTDTAAIPSSLSRFTREVLPMIAGRTSDLIVETWITDGACGPAEAATIAGVATTTERPAATESEIVTLLRRAKDAGVRPHVLHVSCADYQLLSPPSSSTTSSSSKRGATVDFQRMLTLIERQLRATITKVLAARPAADAAKMVVVYGGALHNDLYPDPALASFSYGVAIFRATGGRYRELDFYVPEYLERSAAMRGESWFPVWQRDAGAGQPAGTVTVIPRSRNSFILIASRR
jgi:hypothetical protein